MIERERRRRGSGETGTARNERPKTGEPAVRGAIAFPGGAHAAFNGDRRIEVAAGTAATYRVEFVRDALPNSESVTGIPVA